MGGGVYFVKILLVVFYLSISDSIVHGTAISKHENNTAREILASQSLPFEDCGSKYLILNLNISSCNSIPCVMRRGSTVQVNVLFDDHSDNISYLKHRVRWIFNAIKTQAYITPDVCDGVHKCLSKDKDRKLYWAILSVNNSLPAISGTMLWEVVNEYNEEVVCFKIPVVVTM